MQAPANPISRRTQIDQRTHNGKEVVFLRTEPRVQVPILAGNGRLSLLVVGGIVGKSASPGVCTRPC